MKESLGSFREKYFIKIVNDEKKVKNSKTEETTTTGCTIS